jgi:hypothetical protein
MYKKVRITIGPDPVYHSGTCWHLSAQSLDGDWESHDSGGWGGSGPRRSEDPDAWFALAKRRLGLPPFDGVRRWTDADVRPDGYSQGLGHAPQGVRIEWSLA